MSDLQKHVIEFHCAFEHPIAASPTVPSDDRVRFRARLITEEYLETMRALFDWSFGEACDVLADNIENAAVKVDLVELADGLGDLDVVVEGTRLECGIDGDPVEREIHRSNMAKLGGGRRSDGKTLKPEGWLPPDIKGLLELQREDPLRSLAWTIIKLGPATVSASPEQRLDFAYGNLAASSNHRPTRAAFAYLAMMLGWTTERFDGWAAQREWADR